MDDRLQAPSIEVGRSSRPQKFKDTCDMCSASKIRCDKKKPICNRCERLGYPCFFSPARRVRKRRCKQSTPSGNKPEAAGKSSEPQTIHVVGDKSVIPRYKASDDAIDFKSRDEVNGDTLPEASTSQSSTLSGSSSSMPLQNASSHQHSHSSTMQPMSMELEQRSGSPSIASEFDCAAVAMNLLQRLNTSSMPDSCTTTSSGGMQAPALDALFTTASIAIKRVSIILICPCSKKSDAGLLAAAVCAALLDTYELILRNSTTESTAVSPSMDEHIGNQRPLVDGAVRQVEGMGTRAIIMQGRSNEKATITRLLNELPKLANLVTQFTQRYGPNAETSSGELHQALAASMTSRLKAMIDEVTNWVAQM